MEARTPEEIRLSIEANRLEFEAAIKNLRHEVSQLTDWRLQLKRHRKAVLITAAVAGVVVAGGFGVVGRLFGGRC